MIETNVLMELIEQIKTGNTLIIAGVIILLLVPIIRNAVLPEIKGTANQIISSLSAAFGGIAVLLVAGQPFWASVILGLFAAPTSSGLVPLVRSLVRWLIKKSPKSSLVNILIFFAIVPGAGCAAFQNQHCRIEKQIVNSLGIGLAVTDATVGDNNNEHYNEAMTAARGVQTLGRQAVRACELVRDGAAWQQWVLLAIETVGAVVGVIEGANEENEVTAPAELHKALENLRNESNSFITMAQ